MKAIACLLFLVSFGVLAVPMGDLVEGDKLLVSSDGRTFTERFFVSSCYVKTDTEFKETIVISELATGSSLFTWLNQYTKTLAGDTVIADVVTISPTVAAPDLTPREYLVPKSQLLGLLTQLSNLNAAKADTAKALRAISDLFDKGDEVAAELAEIRRIILDDEL